MSKVEEYIKEAKKYLSVAKKEIAEWHRDGRIELGVDGCDKGWLSFHLALKAYFLKKGVKEEDLPETHRGIRYFLRKYGTDDLMKSYRAFRDILHVEGYYDRSPDYEDVNQALKEIEKFIKKIESGR